MSDPSAVLQSAQVTQLKDDGTLSALVADRITDPSSSKPLAFPYITIGEGQVLGDDTEDCGDGSEVFTRTHVWSRVQDGSEVKRIAAEVRRILKAAPSLTGFDVSVVEFVQTQFLRDPDGITRHAVIEHRYLITHAS